MTAPLNTPGVTVDRELDGAGAPVKSPRRRRSTTHISRAQAKNLIDALSFADTIGLPLNISIDIHWEMFAGFADDQTRMARCQERMRKWCDRRGFQLAWVWVREIGRRGGRNTHILMHVPPWLMKRHDFRAAFEAELEASLRPEGEPTHEKAILIKPADYPLGKLQYMLKGIARADASRLGIRKTRCEGEIVGKRVGYTESIGKTARKRHNWVRAQPPLVTRPDAANLRSNKAYGPAKPQNRESKFEGGIRGTNLDAGSRADEAAIHISLPGVDASRFMSQDPGCMAKTITDTERDTG
jgi:hypothetical protein